jgi:transaldolase
MYPSSHILDNRKGKNVKFFIDTANVKEIREAASLGVVDGVTTNH